ncbi:hypothetical protein H9Q13_08860 [Pontibacter sp. JH31]|uniref:Secreted protein n=1 Tax=Pontibacter aquaedesilientis TaxID=2766980 RepID=A0ABR7XG52_9BACT|nr:hypothetical protein [Pontibacter aquaedesilientis]MBD1397272.1 hypothetical protein [Pontibacter aquaedesilientis]
MHRFTTYIALFLLLLFTRAMVPDQLLLSLHSHAHTEHSHLAGDQNKAQVDKKHSHCPVEDLFGAPYHGVTEVYTFPELSILPEHTARYTAYQAFDAHARLALRGPPAVV